jgi:hypothetical protein
LGFGLKTEAEAEQASFAASVAGIGFDTIVVRNVHKRREVPERNTFVPFVAVYHHPERVRPADQIREAVRIGMAASGGHLCFSTLQTLQEHPDIARVVRETITSEV